MGKYHIYKTKVCHEKSPIFFTNYLFYNFRYFLENSFYKVHKQIFKKHVFIRFKNKKDILLRIFLNSRRN